MINEPKYDIEDGRIVNASTRVPIPDDEPIMIFRAKDRKAMCAISAYLHNCDDPYHKAAVAFRAKHFIDYAASHQTKEPDSYYPLVREELKGE